MIKRYLQGVKGDAGNNEFRRLFLSGSTRFLNAYPRSKNGIRTLPTPLSWNSKKDEQEPVYDLVLMEKKENPGQLYIKVNLFVICGKMIKAMAKLSFTSLVSRSIFIQPMKIDSGLQEIIARYFVIKPWLAVRTFVLLFSLKMMVILKNCMPFCRAT